MALLVVTGSRQVTDRNQVRAALLAAADLIGEVPELVHGGAAGADRLCAQVAAELGWTTREVRPDWSRHDERCPAHHAGQPTCKGAGLRRNREMLALGPDMVLGFPAHERELSPGQDRHNTSRRTWYTIDEATGLGLTVLVAWQGRLWASGTTTRELLGSMGLPNPVPVPANT